MYSILIKSYLFLKRAVSPLNESIIVIKLETGFLINSRSKKAFTNFDHLKFIDIAQRLSKS